ncbi:4-hydroxyproline epimerase [Posidoniimonas polymericola]|uniref:4-hydroxyproline epimerase n=1 Tax=Posidoniimonas polymericola TaxID=2528002 RepID=A0A5C5YLD8_9BACT|nr:proline racemase family protein [Posidoniimonas polymericola]TWT75711.1 4-hydroxyproline epimerase [Posidoniimonas polymericola]
MTDNTYPSGTLRVIDSHTAGEPTRVVAEGAPNLGSGDMRSRLQRMRAEADWLRTSLVLEPRGSEAMVGALLQPPVSPAAVAGVLFFNNAGYLGMCGHGAIGVVATLAYLDRIRPGRHCIETPVGDISIELSANGEASIENVRSYRWAHDVEVSVEGLGKVRGEVAYGGNWFFFTKTERRLRLDDHAELTSITSRIRRALREQGITGEGGAEIDHVELIGPPSDPVKANAKNFVLCPGEQYDRSPCGTGTSAKLACLAADGALAEGDTWRQESIVGGVFRGQYRSVDGGVIPTITGTAYVNGDTRLLFHPEDPFRHGILPAGPNDHA